jgi:hypothetical protein
MKQGLNLLIIGGGLVATGLIVASISTFSVTKQVLDGSTPIALNTLLEPNVSIAGEIIDLPAGQQLLLSLSGNPVYVPLQARIVGPDGNLLSLYDIPRTPFTSTVITKISGNYTVEIKNVGSSPVTINSTLLNYSIGEEQGNGTGEEKRSAVQSLITYGIEILVGISLIIAGIVLLVIGGIKYIRGKSAPPHSASP